MNVLNTCMLDLHVKYSCMQASRGVWGAPPPPPPPRKIFKNRSSQMESGAKLVFNPKICQFKLMHIHVYDIVI